MTVIPEIPLLFVGKDSLFPFTGMFFARHSSERGWCHLIGRCYKADVKDDFWSIRQFEHRVQQQLQEQAILSCKEQFQALWKMLLEDVKDCSPVTTLVCLIATEEVVAVGGFGVSGLWGSQQKVWYPLVPDGHPFFALDDIPDEKAHVLFLERPPQQILVRAKPSRDDLFASSTIEQRIFEVGK